MIKSKPKLRGRLKRRHRELPARKRRWEHWLLEEEELTSTPAPGWYPAVSCQGSSGSNFSGLKGKTNTFWSHGGRGGLCLHLCHSAVTCSECPGGSHPTVSISAGSGSPLLSLYPFTSKNNFWALCGEKGGRMCLSCSKIVLWKDKLTLLTFKN